MTEEEIARATTEYPWKNIGMVAVRVAIYALIDAEKPTTVTVKKTRGTDGKWVFNVAVREDK